MFSIVNRALSWVITSFGNKFCLKKRSRLIKALNNRIYVKFMQLGIGLFSLFSWSTFLVLREVFRIPLVLLAFAITLEGINTLRG